MMKKVVSLLLYSLMNVFSSGTHCLFTSKAESTSRLFSVRQRPKFSGFLYLQHLTDPGNSCPSPHSLRSSAHPSQLSSLSRLSSPLCRQRALDCMATRRTTLEREDRADTIFQEGRGQKITWWVEVASSLRELEPESPERGLQQNDYPSQMLHMWEDCWK